MRESKVRLEKAAEVLQKAAQLQTAFWDSLELLENQLDIELDSTDDLAAAGVDDLCSRSEKDGVDPAAIKPLLDNARELQGQFWGALNEVEQLLKIEIDSTNILGDATIGDLLASCRRREERKNSDEQQKNSQITVTGDGYTLTVSLSDGRVADTWIADRVGDDVRSMLEEIDRFDVHDAAEWVERYTGDDSIDGHQFPFVAISYWKKDGSYSAAEDDYREEVELAQGGAARVKP
jgi:tetratricopeptide (TPR) repeat protein